MVWKETSLVSVLRSWSFCDLGARDSVSQRETSQIATQSSLPPVMRMRRLLRVVSAEVRIRPVWDCQRVRHSKRWFHFCERVSVLVDVGSPGGGGGF